MSDNYQTVYDAVRSVARGAFSGQSAYDAVREVAGDAFSGVNGLLRQEIYVVSSELTRPSRTMRPRVFKDGDQWCALYVANDGDNIQDGVCGFGESPEKACQAFDAAWAGQPAKKGEE